jgi:D-3-phosphoglycerate dehydrogenase
VTRPLVALITDVDWEGLSVEEQALLPVGCEIVVAPDSSPEALRKLVPHADVIMVCFATLPATVIAEASSARAILRWGGGTNNIDLDAARAHHIPVYNVPDFCVEEVADHALMMILALSRGLERQIATTRSGGWSLPGDLPRRLSTQTLGLVGMGRTGQALARRAQVLGMSVRYTMSERKLPDDITATRATNLATLASEVDVMSLHLPLTEETFHIIDAEVLRVMRPHATLINVARGGLVHTDDLVKALESRTIQSAGLDVTDPEPLPADHLLRFLPQCLVTPHFAYRSREAITEVRERVALAARDIVQDLVPNPRHVSLVK